MNHLESAFSFVINVFNGYAKGGNNESLSKLEFERLIREEMPETLENAKDKAFVDKLVKDLDENGDEVDFRGYMKFVAEMTVRRFEEMH
ncbi:protein S100-A12-like [Eleutherodactylus coqui]|uniref:protein S100-A12-like n=1 Tax=Eleutherodactylus coqui TaxID=57060 RepID=UPI0034628D26